MTQGRNLREVGVRVEALLGELRSVAEPAVQRKAEELVRLLVELYGAGLERIVEIVVGHSDNQALIDQLVSDPFVTSLLVLHGLHPVPVEARIQRALDEVRPYLGSHAGGVEFLGVDAEGVARLQLQGSCDGCPSSTLTVKMAIEQAIEEAAPEVTRVEVEGVTAPPETGGSVQQGLRRQPTEAGDGPPPTRWTHVGSVGTWLPGTLAALDLGGTSVLVLSAAGSIYAYRNACASCDSSLAGGTLDETVLVCPACGRKYDVRLAGRGLDDANVHLDPLPLLADKQSVRVAVPLGAK